MKPEIELCADKDTHIDEIAGYDMGFDFSAVYEHVDAKSGDELADEIREAAYAQLAYGLRVVLQWLVDVPVGAHIDTLIGRRALSLAWIIDPSIISLIKDEPSLRGLARKLQHPHAMTMSSITSEASRKFGITNRSQSPATTRAETAARGK